MILDKWQEDVLKIQGDLVMRTGRQVGKSQVVSIKAVEFAVNNPKKTILVIAAVERQARLLFDKILGYLMEKYPKLIAQGKDKPTQHRIILTNKSEIYALPTGLSGYSIRGYTAHLLIADEAAFIPESVWVAVTPMLAASKGVKWLLSTPHNKEGYYYDCFKDPNFTAFHISSEDCPRIPKDFLAREKSRLTKAQYAQEYLGEFVDELSQWFTDELIKSCMTIDPVSVKFDISNNVSGWDIAQMGADETAGASFSVFDKKMRMIDLQVTTKTRLTDTIALIRLMHDKFHYKRVYIDDNGIGAGVLDALLQDDNLKSRVVGINNAKKSLDKNKLQTRKLMKEDLYANLLRLMEQHDIEFFNSPEIMLSLRSVQYEYEDGKLKIFGNYTHICESIIRAAWHLQTTNLNIWCGFTKHGI